MNMLRQILVRNDLHSFILACVIFTVTWLGFHLFRKFVLTRITQGQNSHRFKIIPIIEYVFSKTKTLFLFIISLDFALMALKLPPHLTAALSKIAFVVLLFQFGIWLSAFLDYWIEEQSKTGPTSGYGTRVTTFKAIGIFSRIVVWSIFLLLVLENLGVNVKTLLAGLGVGGIAVALALQSILSDLFASLTIVLDKPFAVGDFIAIDTQSGWVEQVGLKTTRIRTPAGNELIFSNNDLLKSRIENYKQLAERRIMFTFGITYETPIETVRRIPKMIVDILSVEKQARYERAHFFKLGESSLDFEVVYFVLSPDYKTYMEIQQRVNLALMEKFQAEKVSFSYPTRTLYMASNVPSEKLSP